MGKLAFVGAVLFVGCGGTPYQRCKTAAAFQTDPVVRELQLNRCEEQESRRSAEQMHQQEISAAERMHAEEMSVERERTEAVTEAVRPKPVAVSAPAPAAAGDVQCVRDYQCTGAGERCVDGQCVGVGAQTQAGCRLTGNGATTAIFPTQEGFEEAWKATSEGVKGPELRKVLNRVGAVPVEVGSTCRVVQHAGELFRIEVVDGPSAGRTGWTHALSIGR